VIGRRPTRHARSGCCLRCHIDTDRLGVASPRDHAFQLVRGIDNLHRPDEQYGGRRAVVSAIVADARVHVPELFDNGGGVNCGRLTASYLQQGRYQLVLAAFCRSRATVTIEDTGDGHLVSDRYGTHILSLGGALLRVASADDVWPVLANL
jgi:hypothetical protein